MVAELHKTQEALLELLRSNNQEPLTIRELQEELDVSSSSVIFHHIQQLEKKGFIKKNPNNPRDYQVLSEPENPITYLNQYGLAQCGPNGSFLSGNPLDRIPIASRLIKFSTVDAFCVTAKGNSMEPNISDGDLVIAKKCSEAENGSFVICVNEGSVLIKKFYRNEDIIILHSSNSDFDPFMASGDFRIEGVVKSIIKYSSFED